MMGRARRDATVLAALLCAIVLGSADAAVSADEAEALKTRLTPVGAERAGNQDGTIPAWTGGYSTVPPGYVDGTPRADPFAGEKPLFSITGATLGTYGEHLPEGQKALLQRFPDYRMDVYPAHRTAAAPQEVYDSIFRNATRAHAGADGIASGIAGAAGGIPFPIPHDGAEIVWNHLLAFWGPAREDTARTYFVAANGTLVLTNQYRETVDFPYYYPRAEPDGFGDYYFKRREVSDGPPQLAGRGYVLWQPIDLARAPLQAWEYLPGQRRVRRSPSLAYDAPTPDGSGILSFDEYYVFSGSPDRYRFTLLGKREMYVPYNNNRFQQMPVAALAKPHFADPGAIRYELHRVWVVDAELAPGKRHLAPHRRLYFDEDTWFAVYCDAWDEDGHLWKFSQGTMYLVPDLPAVVLAGNLTYDLEQGGYVLALSFNDAPVQFKLMKPHDAAAFSPETLAAEGVR